MTLRNSKYHIAKQMPANIFGSSGKKSISAQESTPST